MNILFISHETEFNGATLSLLGMIDELKTEHNIYVLSPLKEGRFLEELSNRNIRVICAKFYSHTTAVYSSKPKFLIKWLVHLLLPIFFHPILALRLGKQIKELDIDIIHTNTSIMNIGAVLSKVHKIPHVLHIREFVEEDFGLLFVPNRKYVMEFYNRNCAKVISVSKAIDQKYDCYFDKGKMSVIYNGIKTDYLNQKKRPDFKTGDHQVLLITGSLSEGKGQKEAVLGFKELLDRGYDNLSLHIAGDGEEHFKDELNNLINELGLEEKVTLLGRVNNLFEIRKNINIELVCSKNEAFGRVTIEAMMSSNVVVGANTGGTVELITHEYNGLLYEQGDSTDLANKIQLLLDDTSLIKKLGENAYNFAKERFTTKGNAQRVNEVYQEINRLVPKRVYEK